MEGYLDAWATKGAPDHVWMEHIFPAMGDLKRSFARLSGCSADEVAITTNISIAVSTIASALDLSERPKVVLSELDFPTDGHVWLAQRRRGVEIEWLRSPDGLTIPLEAFDRAIDERTGLVFLHARRDLLPVLRPTVTGWFATREPFSFDLQELEYHPSARRLEHGTPPAPAVFIAQGGFDVISEVTPERIRARQGELTEHVIGRADGLGLPVRTPRDRDARGGVVNVGVGPDAERICHVLLDRDVCTDSRGDGLRISPHFFNTEDDVDRCFDELRTLL